MDEHPDGQREFGDGFGAALAGFAGEIEEAFDLGVLDDDLAVLADVDQVVRVEAVELVDVDAVLAVAEGKDGSGVEAAREGSPWSLT